MSANSTCQTAERLYLEHHSWLQEWFRARLSCHSQAADLAQDTFVRVLLRDQFRQDSLERPRAFLKVIANGILVDHYRRRTVERAFLNALSALPEPEIISEEEKHILLATLQQIDKALDGLPAPVRKAFLLSQLEHLTYAEIATQMNISVRTVKRYMRRGFSQCLAVLL